MGHCVPKKITKEEINKNVFLANTSLEGHLFWNFFNVLFFSSYRFVSEMFLIYKYI